MDPITKQGATAAAGKVPDYVGVDNVFQALHYHGNDSARTINTPKVDLSDGGGLVISKSISGSRAFTLFNTEHGAGIYQRTNVSNGVQTMSQGVTGFGSETISLGTDANVNNTNEFYGALIFKKQEHFFDIVQYTGNGASSQTISHNLGSQPGMIWVKAKNSSGDWAVYHKNEGAGKYAKLNSTSEFFTNFNFWNNTNPNGSNFTVGSDGNVNNNGTTYTAYLFGHNRFVFGEDEDEQIITMGQYTGNGSTTKRSIGVGFEPELLLVKRADNHSDWHVFCSDWGFKAVGHGDSKRSVLNGSGPHNGWGRLQMHPYGFFLDGESNSQVNANNSKYIYMAVRRSNRVPETPTDVFEDSTRLTTTGNTPRFSGCVPGPEFVIYNENQNNTDFQIAHKFAADGKYHQLNQANAHATDTARYNWERQGGFGTSSSYDSTRLAWMFKRGKKFCDFISYYGNDSSQAVRHNLGIAPKMVWVKQNAGQYFTVFLDAPSAGGGKYIRIADGTHDVPATSSTVWDNTAPDANYLYLGNAGSVNDFYYHEAYLFGDCPGISKLGYYNGASDTVTITTGFQPRVVMIKNLTNADPWWWCNSLLGITNGGNDTVLQLGSTANSYGGYNIVDVSATGFSTPNTNRGWNQTGNEYFYWAIA